MKKGQQYVWIVPLVLLIVVVGFAILSGPQYQLQLLKSLNATVNQTTKIQETTYEASTKASNVIYEIKDLYLASKVIRYYAKDENPIKEETLLEGSLEMRANLFDPESNHASVYFYIDNLKNLRKLTLQIKFFEPRKTKIYVNNNFLTNLNYDSNITIPKSFLVSGKNKVLFEIDFPWLPFQENKVSFSYKITKEYFRTYRVALKENEYLKVHGRGECKILVNGSVFKEGICEYYGKPGYGVYEIIPINVKDLSIKVEEYKSKEYSDIFELDQEKDLKIIYIAKNNPVKICINDYCRIIYRNSFEFEVPANKVSIGTNTINIKCLAMECYITLLKIEKIE